MTQFGIFARVFSRTTPDEVGEAVAAAGYELIQLNLSSVGESTLPEGAVDWDRVRQAFALRAIKIWGVSATFNAIDPDSRRRRRSIDLASRLIAALPALGVGVATLCTGTRDPVDMWRQHPGNREPAAWSDLRQTLDRLLPVAAAHQVILGIEPEPGNVVSDADAAGRLIKELGDDARHIGMIIDPANLVPAARAFEQRTILTRAVDMLAPHVIGFHAKDVEPAGRVVPAGTGVLDYPLIARLHVGLGRDVPVVVQDVSETQAASTLARLERIWSEA